MNIKFYLVKNNGAWSIVQIGGFFPDLPTENTTTYVNDGDMSAGGETEDGGWSYGIEAYAEKSYFDGNNLILEYRVVNNSYEGDISGVYITYIGINFKDGRNYKLFSGYMEFGDVAQGEYVSDIFVESVSGELLHMDLSQIESWDIEFDWEEW